MTERISGLGKRGLAFFLDQKRRHPVWECSVDEFIQTEASSLHFELNSLIEDKNKVFPTLLEDRLTGRLSNRLDSIANHLFDCALFKRIHDGDLATFHQCAWLAGRLGYVRSLISNAPRHNDEHCYRVFSWMLSYAVGDIKCAQQHQALRPDIAKRGHKWTRRVYNILISERFPQLWDGRPDDENYTKFQGYYLACLNTALGIKNSDQTLAENSIDDIFFNEHKLVGNHALGRFYSIFGHGLMSIAALGPHRMELRVNVSSDAYDLECFLYPFDEDQVDYKPLEAISPEVARVAKCLAAEINCYDAFPQFSGIARADARLYNYGSTVVGLVWGDKK